jgi:hypothetical protein
VNGKCEENEQFAVTPHPAFSHLLPDGEGNMQWLGSRASRTIIEGTVVFEEIADIRTIQGSTVNFELINVTLPRELFSAICPNLQYFQWSLLSIRTRHFMRAVHIDHRGAIVVLHKSSMTPCVRWIVI